MCQVGLPRQKMKYRYNRASYIQLVYQEYQCHQGKDKNIRKKQKYHSERKCCSNARPLFSKKQTYDSSNKLSKTVKKIFRKKKKKNRCFKKLKNHIKCNFEEQILASLKLSDTVSLLGICYKRGINAITRAAGLVEPLDNRVSQHLKYTFVLLICYCLMVFLVG